MQVMQIASFAGYFFRREDLFNNILPRTVIPRPQPGFTADADWACYAQRYAEVMRGNILQNLRKNSVHERYGLTAAPINPAQRLYIVAHPERHNDIRGISD
jgi:hypothetical protein